MGDRKGSKRKWVLRSTEPQKRQRLHTIGRASWEKKKKGNRRATFWAFARRRDYNTPRQKETFSIGKIRMGKNVQKDQG